jgi:hypothetical protein
MDFPLPLPEPCRVFGKRKWEEPNRIRKLTPFAPEASRSSVRPSRTLRAADAVAYGHP